MQIFSSTFLDIVALRADVEHTGKTQAPRNWLVMGKYKESSQKLRGNSYSNGRVSRVNGFTLSVILPITEAEVL